MLRPHMQILERLMKGKERVKSKEGRTRLFHVVSKLGLSKGRPLSIIAILRGKRSAGHAYEWAKTGLTNYGDNACMNPEP